MPEAHASGEAPSGASAGDPSVPGTPATDSALLSPFRVPRGYRYDPVGSRVRRRYDIRAYVGLNGAGKTLAMMHDAIPDMLAGRRILSTVTVLDPRTGGEYEHFERLSDWHQLLEARDCLALFDEVQGIANSRASQGMPVQVQTFLHQLRRKDITLAWTSPSWSRADLLLREVTRSVTVCRGYLPERRAEVDPLTGEVRMLRWGANRLFRWLTYDAADFTEWTDNKEADLKGKDNTWYFRPGISLGPLLLLRPALAQDVYDTLDPVQRIGEVLDSGRCADCGGTRAPERCSCESYVNRRRAPQRVVIEARPAGR